MGSEKVPFTKRRKRQIPTVESEGEKAEPSSPLSTSQDAPDPISWLLSSGEDPFLSLGEEFGVAESVAQVKLSSEEPLLPRQLVPHQLEDSVDSVLPTQLVANISQTEEDQMAKGEEDILPTQLVLDESPRLSLSNVETEEEVVAPTQPVGAFSPMPSPKYAEEEEIVPTQLVKAFSPRLSSGSSGVEEDIAPTQFVKSNSDDWGLPTQETQEKEQPASSQAATTKGGEEEIRCGICLETVGAEMGTMDKCSHKFCFTCIFQWSGVTNLCPMCKSEFGVITKKQITEVGGKVKVRTQNFRILPKKQRLEDDSEFYLEEDEEFEEDLDNYDLADSFIDDDDSFIDDDEDFVLEEDEEEEDLIGGNLEAELDELGDIEPDTRGKKRKRGHKEKARGSLEDIRKKRKREESRKAEREKEDRIRSRRDSRGSEARGSMPTFGQWGTSQAVTPRKSVTLVPDTPPSLVRRASRMREVPNTPTIIPSTPERPSPSPTLNTSRDSVLDFDFRTSRSPVSPIWKLKPSPQSESPFNKTPTPVRKPPKAKESKDVQAAWKDFDRVTKAASTPTPRKSGKESPSIRSPDPSKETPRPAMSWALKRKNPAGSSPSSSLPTPCFSPIRRRDSVSPSSPARFEFHYPSKDKPRGSEDDSRICKQLFVSRRKN